jgi:hypothetical protein
MIQDPPRLHRTLRGVGVAEQEPRLRIGENGVCHHLLPVLGLRNPVGLGVNGEIPKRSNNIIEVHC